MEKVADRKIDRSRGGSQLRTHRCAVGLPTSELGVPNARTTWRTSWREARAPLAHQTCRAVRHDMEWKQQCRDMSMKARVLGSPGERDLDPGLGVRDWGPWLAGRERLGTLGASSGNSGGS